MIVKHLVIAGLRNIARIELDAHPRINWLMGANGAGKTSILESLFLLARGRSFRGRKHGPLIGTHQDRLEVGTRILRPGSAENPFLCHSLHYVLTRDQASLSENGQVVSHVQSLRYPLQVRVIADNSQRLLEGQPEIRRLFLDWNLFHVEPSYGRILSEFKKVLAQRNAWLKSGGQGPPVWNRKYCLLAEEITRARLRFTKGIEAGLSALAECVGYPDSLTMRLLPGWDTTNPLYEVLNRNLHNDLKRGFTFYGPNRGDFEILCGDSHYIPSRGQTKMLVCLLQMAAERYAIRQGKDPCIWLVDDLAAELDASGQEKIHTTLNQLGEQIFITSLYQPNYPLSCLEPGLMFHVKQGRLEGQEALR